MQFAQLAVGKAEKFDRANSVMPFTIRNLYMTHWIDSVASGGRSVSFYLWWAGQIGSLIRKASGYAARNGAAAVAHANVERPLVPPWYAKPRLLRSQHFLERKFRG